MRTRPSELSREAISRLGEIGASPAANASEVARLLHELEVHQIELETQNDELRHTQVELEKARDGLWKLYDLAPVGYLTLDPEGAIVDANLKAASLLGRDRSALRGLKLGDFMSSADAATFARHRLDALAGDAQVGCDLHIRRPDGRSVPAHLDSSAEPDTATRSGAPARLRTVVFDLSEIQKVQDDLRRSNERLVEAHEFLENLLESSTEYSIIAKDLERRILTWNAGAARNYRYEAAEVIGKSADVLHTPEEVRSGVVAALHQRALEQGHATGLFRRRRKDGSEFLARVMITRRNDAQGNAVGYLLVSHDVTAEQRHVDEQRFLAEVGEALQESLDPAETLERVARLVVGFMGDWCAIDAVREDGSVQRIKAMSADPPRAEVSKALESVPPLGGGTHPLWQVLKTRQPLLISDVNHQLLRSIARDEEHMQRLQALDVRSFMLVPLVARGRLNAVLSIASWRPNRRYGPPDLRLAQELARRASLALDNAQLYALAREAIGARDQLLAVVAHDLRNPLGTILLQAHTLGRHEGKPERRSRKPGETIERAATRMSRLIQDLLDVTRLEAGALGIERARVPVEDLVSGALEAHKTLAASAGLGLDLAISEGLPAVWADRHRLLQVFENLLGNAIKFTGRGGRITAGAASRGAEVVFWVADTGAGIAEEDVPHLFERFWQGTKVGRQGAGLGLPIAKAIVEAHGGRIWVKTTPGRGTTFFFTIPANPDEDPRHESLANRP